MELSKALGSPDNATAEEPKQGFSTLSEDGLLTADEIMKNGVAMPAVITDATLLETWTNWVDS